mmetsp:Transcript_12591/g.37858  ORF Transcript_12591/g.37858 Transcript_12591/m.37858 type:complete len:205 (-) Transcript_12591:704-1318(-)
MLGVLLVVHDVAGVRHVVVLCNAALQGLDEVEGEQALAGLGLPVVGAHHRLASLGGSGQVVVRDLGQQVVHDVGADVVMDLVEDAVVPVQGGQTSPQVGPLLATVPGDLVLLVLGAVVVQVGDHVQPHHIDPVRHHVQLQHCQRAQEVGARRQDGQHARKELVRSLDQLRLGLGEQFAVGVEVAAGLAGAARHEVEGVRKHRQQ